MTREELLSSPEYWITRLQVAFHNCASMFMSKNKKNRTQLAEHLGVTKSYVSQLFNGTYDHRLSKFFELSLSFGYVPVITFKPLEQVIWEDRENKIDYTKINESILQSIPCIDLGDKANKNDTVRIMRDATRIDLNAA